MPYPHSNFFYLSYLSSCHLLSFSSYFFIPLISAFLIQIIFVTTSVYSASSASYISPPLEHLHVPIPFSSFSSDRYSFSDRNSLSGLYLKETSIVYLEERGSKSSFCNVDHCSIFNSSISTFFSNTNASKTLLPLKYHSHSHLNSNNGCKELCQSIDQAITKSSDTLLIFTTCNHLSVSIHSLQSLSSHTAYDSYDIIIIDDHSIDGTPSYLKKKGYFVIEKDQPLGLTHSWNVGYRIAKYLKYKYVIFANNDILVPHGAVDMCRRSLVTEALVVPMTTKKGAGHNPSQSISLIHSFNAYQNQFVNNPANFQLVQNLLDAMMRSKGETNLLEKSIWNNKLKFNGFFFAVNTELIAPAAYDDDNLFDPGNIMVSQEDTLMHAMESFRLYPMISRYAFVYHFKSITVKVANHVIGSKNETRNNLQHYHPELDSNFTKLQYPQLYSSYQTVLLLPEMEFYPLSPKRKIIGLIIPSKLKFASASDLETAQALEFSLQKFFDVEIRFIVKTGSWYDLNGVDILISLYDLLQFSEIINAKPTLFAVAWLRTNYFRWISASSLGAYDLILLPSEGSYEHFRAYFESKTEFPLRCQIRCPSFMKHIQQRSPVIVDTLRNAADSRINSQQIPANARKDFSVDYLVLVNLPYTDVNSSNFQIDGLSGAMLIGRRWKPLFSHGDGVLLKGIEMMNKVFQSARVVLEHVNNDHFVHTGLSHNCLNALASGKMVLTNAKPNLFDPITDKLLAYTSVADMKKLVRTFLTSRSNKPNIQTLQQEVMSKHTFDQRVESFNKLLVKNFNFSLPRSLNPSTQSIQRSDETHQSFCLIVRLHSASRDTLQMFLQNVFEQYSRLNNSLKLQLKLKLFVLKPHFLSADMTSVLKDFLKEVLGLADFGSELQLFYDPHFSSQNRKSLDGMDDIDHLLHRLHNENICDWMAISNPKSYFYHPDWLSTITPAIVSQQHTLISWNYISNSSVSQATEINFSSSDSLSSLNEKIQLGGMIFSSLSLKNHLPSFMYFDSKLSLPVLEKRVVRSIIQATGTQHHYHYHRPLMTHFKWRSFDESEKRGGGGGGDGRFRTPFW